MLQAHLPSLVFPRSEMASQVGHRAFLLFPVCPGPRDLLPGHGWRGIPKALTFPLSYSSMAVKWQLAEGKSIGDLPPVSEGDHGNRAQDHAAGAESLHLTRCCVGGRKGDSQLEWCELLKP